MALPHFNKINPHANPFEPIYSYCGNCYSDNIDKVGNYFYIDIEGKCECLDCDWKGTKEEFNHMHNYEWERYKKNVIRNRKLKRIC